MKDSRDKSFREMEQGKKTEVWEDVCCVQGTERKQEWLKHSEQVGVCSQCHTTIFVSLRECHKGTSLSVLNIFLTSASSDLFRFLSDELLHILKFYMILFSLMT